jgi:hypothetical protein
MIPNGHPFNPSLGGPYFGQLLYSITELCQILLDLTVCYYRFSEALLELSESNPVLNKQHRYTKKANHYYTIRFIS